MVATKENIEKQRVIQKMVDDWKKRIAMLYSDVKLWSNLRGYTFSLGPKLTMYEEMMSEYGVSPAEVDTADLYKEGKLVLTIKPRGLWITGTNGRLDVLTNNGNYQLIGVSLGKVAKWKLFGPAHRDGVELNKESFLHLLK